MKTIIYFQDSRGKDFCGIKLKQTPHKIQNKILNYLSEQLSNQQNSDFFYQCVQKQTSFYFSHNTQQTCQYFITRVLPFIQSWDIDYISFQFVAEPHLLQSLCHINFEQIIVLQLIECKIQSIEQIPWFQMQKLQCLDLQCNFITNVKPLRKSHINNLTDICLKHNRIKVDQFSFLNSLYMNKYEQITNNQQNDKNLSQNENNKVKIKLSQPDELINLSKRRYELFINGKYFQSDFKYHFGPKCNWPNIQRILQFIFI